MRLLRITLTVVCVCMFLAGTAFAEVYYVSQEQADPSPSDIIVQNDVVQDGGVAQKADIAYPDLCDGGSCCDCDYDPCCCPAP